MPRVYDTARTNRQLLVNHRRDSRVSPIAMARTLLEIRNMLPSHHSRTYRIYSTRMRRFFLNHEQILNSMSDLSISALARRYILRERQEEDSDLDSNREVEFAYTDSEVSENEFADDESSETDSEEDSQSSTISVTLESRSDTDEFDGRGSNTIERDSATSEDSQ